MKNLYFKFKLIFLLLLTGYSMFGQDTCCIDQGLFLEVAQNVQTNGELGDCEIHFLATGMTNCMQITWDFGDGTILGPFADNTPVTHIYSGTNTYTVCHTIEEVNQNGICWGYTECEDVLVLCDSCCNSFDLFCLNIMNGVNITVDNELCKVTLNVDDIPACNYLEYVDWGDASGPDFGPFTNGDMPMHTYSNSGTYIISYLAIEEDPNDGFICFEKIIYDTITLDCETCVCATDGLTISQNGIEYPISCAQGQPTPMLGCPAGDISISGFFGCEFSGSGELCDETPVNWILSGPNGFITNGVTTPFPLFIFPAALVSQPGTYMLTLTTNCPGSLDTCVCIARWIQPDCESCECPLGTFPGPELVVNGHFNDLLPGFTSDYSNLIAPNCSPGKYAIANYFSVPFFCNNWTGIDHTTFLGPGQFFVADGDDNPFVDLAAWRQQLILDGNTQYSFCAFVNNLNEPSFDRDDPIVEVYIVDPLGTPHFLTTSFALPESPDTWVYISQNWTTPPVSGPYQLEFRTASTSFEGNNFAIDDISFKKCSDTPPDSCCTDFDNFLFAAAAVQTNEIISNCQITANGTGLNDCLQISWDWGDGSPIEGPYSNNTPVFHTYSPTGPYTVCYTVEEVNSVGEVCWEAEFCLENQVECDTMVPHFPGFNCGQSVVTCFSGFKNNDQGQGLADDIVVGMFDLRALTNTTANGLNSTPPMVKDPRWIRSNLGQVFGITYDDDYDVYVTATNIYGSFIDANGNDLTFGPAGSGGIYKIDHNTGNPSIFVSTNSIFGSGAGTNTIYNNGAGLGNICFDKDNKQFFVTNFADGLIYRININGIVQNTYDHLPSFTYASTDPRYIPLGDRPFGIGKYGNRLYYGLWNEDQGGRNAVGIYNEIWSIEISNTFPYNFVNNTEQCEIQLPSILSDYSNPPSDIEFSSDGRMLVAERTLELDNPNLNSFGWPAHQSRVLQYSGLAPLAGSCNPVWGTHQDILIGNYSFNIPSYPHANSAGGVDYGFGGYDFDQGKPIECDSLIWGTGDALKYYSSYNYFPGDNDVVYGIAGMPSSGNTSFPGPTFVKTNSYFVDLDGNLQNTVKAEIGDVDVFKCDVCPNTPPPPCDELMVMIDSLDTGPCCWSVDLKNNIGLDIEQVSICVPAPVIINYANLSLGYTINQINNQTLIIEHANGNIPTGQLNNVFQFCLSNITSSSQVPQIIEVKWFEEDANGEAGSVICRDTLTTWCPAPIVSDSCWALLDTTIFCDPDDPYAYFINFTIQNLSSFNVNTVDLNLPWLSPFGFVDCAFPFLSPVQNVSLTIPTVAPGGISTPICVKIVSTYPILSPTNVCFTMSLSGIQPDGHWECCSDEEEVCVTLVPCCDPCEEIGVTVVSTPNDSVECCYSLDIHNPCEYQYFTSIETEIITLGVNFGSHFTGGSTPANWIVSSSPFLITWVHNSTFIPAGTSQDVINFCLDDINHPSEVPQKVVIRWITHDIFGQDSVACTDTLIFDCPIEVDYDCVAIFDQHIECVPDSGYYNFTFTLQNTAYPNHAANKITLIPVIPPSPPFVFGPGSFSFPTLSFGGTYTNTIKIYPLPYLSSLPAGTKLTFEARLSDTNNPDHWCCFESDTFCIIIPACDSCACMIDGVPSPNLVANGNFSMGDASFNSDLPGPGAGNPCQCAAGTYCVGNDFPAKCNGWPSVFDHTHMNSSGSFLMVDGAPNPGQAPILWSQSVNVEEGMTYCFSFWTASVYCDPPQNFNLIVEVTSYADPANPTSSWIGQPNIAEPCQPGQPFTPTWINHTYTWTCPIGFTGPYVLSIQQLAGSAFTDFGIDDICFTKVSSDSCCTDFDAFCNLVAQGFTVTQNGCEVTVCTDQFDTCHFYGTEPYFGDGVPVPQVTVDPDGCWTHTYTQSGTYIICVTVYEDTCWSKEMCTTVTVVCDPLGCVCPYNSLISNPGFENGVAGAPNNSDQIGLATNWFPSINGNNISSIGDWYSVGSPYFPGFFYNAPILQYSPLTPHCGSKYGGVDLNTCEGISSTLTQPINAGDTYTVGFWWSPKERVNASFNYHAILSGGNCNVNVTNSGTCTHQCGGDFHIIVPVTSFNIPGNWYYHTQTGVAPFPVTTITFAGLLGQQPAANYIFIDDVCVNRTPPDSCECLDADGLSFIDISGEITTVPYNAVPVSLSCDSTGNATFYFHGDVHCLGDSCLADDFAWVITDPANTPVYTGTSQLSNNTGKDGHFDILNGYSSFTPGVIYTITVTYYCGTKACTFSVQFVVDCDPCICGEFSDLNWRPSQGAPNMAINCGDALSLGCLQPGFNVTLGGNFSCLGDSCPPVLVKWVLRKAVSNLYIASGVASGPGFIISLPASYFANPGVYELFLVGECDGELCEPCMFTITSQGCPCVCDKFDKIKLVNKKLGINQSLSCDNNPVIPLTCPPAGKPYKVTGKLLCSPTSCQGTNLHWELKQGSTIVTSGNQPGPWFSITLDNSILTGLNGLYDLVLTGLCGNDTCICTLHFDIAGCPIPPGCPCDNEFYSNVSLGVSYEYDYSMGCRMKFTPHLTACDSVFWTVQGIDVNYNASGYTSFNQPYFLNPSPLTTGYFKVSMTAFRPGTTCRYTLCYYVNFSCLITGDGFCTLNEIENSGFNINSTPGILGHEGNTEGWVSRSGSAVLEGGAGCEDEFSLKMIGKCDLIDIDIIDYPIVLLPKSGYKINVCYKAEPGDLKPGTQLVVRLADAPQESGICEGECIEVARLPIELASGEWENISGVFYLEGLEGNKFLTLHIENDLSYEDLDANSTIWLDNICFEQNDSISTVAIDDIDNVNSQIRIYPNPNKGEFKVDLSQPAKKGMTLRVVGLAGQVLSEKEMQVGSEIQTVEVINIPDGMYFLEIISENRVLSAHKFIKQKV